MPALKPLEAVRAECSSRAFKTMLARSQFQTRWVKAGRGLWARGCLRLRPDGVLGPTAAPNAAF